MDEVRWEKKKKKNVPQKHTNAHKMTQSWKFLLLSFFSSNNGDPFPTSFAKSKEENFRHHTAAAAAAAQKKKKKKDTLWIFAVVAVAATTIFSH